MNKYQRELQELKPDDEVQMIERTKEGYDFIYTAGHGYLCIPANDYWYPIACTIRAFGYLGKLACYLEEDCEAPEFLKIATGR